MKLAYWVIAPLDEGIKRFFVLADTGLAAIRKVLDLYGYSCALRTEIPEINLQFFELSEQAEQLGGCIQISD